MIALDGEKAWHRFEDQQRQKARLTKRKKQDVLPVRVMIEEGNVKKTEVGAALVSPSGKPKTVKKPVLPKKPAKAKK
ncbi:MAG: hypothetical protein IPK22_16290 [Verrucomicrobiaceae bacterium]|nr:hypothetical protein [Verrucomicrobiaceae bacterium]